MDAWEGREQGHRDFPGLKMLHRVFDVFEGKLLHEVSRGGDGLWVEGPG